MVLFHHLNEVDKGSPLQASRPQHTHHTCKQLVGDNEFWSSFVLSRNYYKIIVELQ